MNLNIPARFRGRKSTEIICNTILDKQDVCLIQIKGTLNNIYPINLDILTLKFEQYKDL